MRRLNKFTALIVAGVISCTSPMMVMASDSCYESGGGDPEG